VQPRGGFEQVGVLAEDRGKGPGSRGHSLNVRPAAGQRDLQELACEFFGPVGLIHAITLMARAGDVHGHSAPSSDVPACLV
jgi:hypothetical protein